MSLILCPECNHEVSAVAAACPNCGLPITPAAPVVERRILVAEPRGEGFPTWAFVPIGVAVIAVIFFAVYMFRNNDDTANLNVNVNASGRRSTETARTTTSVPPTETSGVTAPPPPAPISQQTVPSTSTSVPVAPLPDKGKVVLTAKIQASSGSAQASRGTRFYLLDRDLDSILSAAGVAPIEGNSLEGSLGLAATDPGRYGDFQRAAMKAIAAHAKYAATTDASGNASFAGVAPNSYYLFAITRAGRGFALWNSQVSVNAGENILNISPQNITEIRNDG